MQEEICRIATLTAATETYNYGASVTSSNITVKDNGLGRTLTNNTDYTIGSYNAVNVWKCNDHSNRKRKLYRNGQRNLYGKCTECVKCSSSYIKSDRIYADRIRDQAPVTAVTAGGHTLTAGTDYTVSYQNNTAVGTAAKVIVTFKGNYTGSKTVYFTIKSNSSSGGDTETKDISTATVTVAHVHIMDRHRHRLSR